MDDLDASRQYATVVLDAVPGRRRPGPGPARAVGPGASAGSIDEATAALAAEMVGTCQAIFDIVHAYVGEREQFGVKIGSFQAIKHKLANMFVAARVGPGHRLLRRPHHRRGRRAPRHGRGHGQGQGG